VDERREVMAKKNPWVNVRKERPSKRRLTTHKRRLNEIAQSLRDGSEDDLIEQKEDDHADDT
jgi:ABC-type Fe3+-citrate transport system substrate-binding protein